MPPPLSINDTSIVSAVRAKQWDRALAILKQHSTPSQQITASAGNSQPTVIYIPSKEILNEQDSNGNTVLHWVCWHNNPQFLQVLASSAALLDIRIQNSSGETSAHWAAKSGNIQALSLLVQMEEWERKQGESDSEYKSVLDQHSQYQKLNILSIRDFEGLTPFIIASQFDQVNVMEFLYLSAGISIEEHDNLGRTSLMWTCYRGCAKAVPYLLSRAASVSHRDQDGLTALHWAALRDCNDTFVARDTLQWLIRVGGVHLINEPDLFGETPFNIAVRKQNWSLVMYFLKCRIFYKLFGNPILIREWQAWVVVCSLGLNFMIMVLILGPKLWNIGVKESSTINNDSSAANEKDIDTSSLYSYFQNLLTTFIQLILPSTTDQYLLIFWYILFFITCKTWIHCKTTDPGSVAPKTILSQQQRILDHQQGFDVSQLIESQLMHISLFRQQERENHMKKKKKSKSGWGCIGGGESQSQQLAKTNYQGYGKLQSISENTYSQNLNHDSDIKNDTNNFTTDHGIVLPKLSAYNNLKNLKDMGTFGLPDDLVLYGRYPNIPIGGGSKETGQTEAGSNSDTTVNNNNSTGSGPGSGPPNLPRCDSKILSTAVIPLLSTNLFIADADVAVGTNQQDKTQDNSKVCQYGLNSCSKSTVEPTSDNDQYTVSNYNSTNANQSEQDSDAQSQGGLGVAYAINANQALSGTQGQTLTDNKPPLITQIRDVLDQLFDLERDLHKYNFQRQLLVQAKERLKLGLDNHDYEQYINDHVSVKVGTGPNNQSIEMTNTTGPNEPVPTQQQDSTITKSPKTLQLEDKELTTSLTDLDLKISQTSVKVGVLRRWVFHIPTPSLLAYPTYVSKSEPDRYTLALHGPTYLTKILNGDFNGLNVTCRCLLTRRSKYCKESGLVIERFDHRCPWIDSTVGLGN